jgi:monoamine oxidase
MQDVLDRLFPKDPLLKRILGFHLASYEGSPTPLLCPYHNIGVLKSIIFGGLPSVRQPSTDARPIFHHVTLKGGNASLPLKIREKMSSSLHLNKVLKEVCAGERNQLMLFFQDGSAALCDKLILAVPCSVYQDISFDNKVIPSEKLKKIKRVQYGSNGKILAPMTGGHLAHNGVMTDKMFAFFMGESKVLTLYFSRKSGQNLLKNLKDLFQEARAVLKLGFKGSSLTEHLPVIANDDQLTPYDKPVAKSWWEDIYAKGSYSNFGVGLKEQFDEKTTYKGVSVKTMFEPVDNRVFFAGEHTTILDVIGTMEAAVESGNRISALF